MQKHVIYRRALVEHDACPAGLAEFDRFWLAYNRSPEMDAANEALQRAALELRRAENRLLDAVHWREPTADLVLARTLAGAALTRALDRQRAVRVEVPEDAAVAITEDDFPEIEPWCLDFLQDQGFLGACRLPV